MIDRLVVYLLFAGCLMFGTIVLIELESGDTDDAAIIAVAAPPDVAPALRRQQGPRPDELLAITLARPLFSSTRRPPQSAANEAGTDSELADTRLTGILTEPGHRIAIFAVNGAKPLTVTEGETVSGWRIETITPREVSLSGPGGAKTLQPKVDPNLTPPVGPSPAASTNARPPGVPAGARPPALPAAAAIGLPHPAVPPVPGAPPPRPARLGQRR